IRHDDVEAQRALPIHLQHPASVRFVRVVGGSREHRDEALVEVVAVHHHLMRADDEVDVEGDQHGRQYILPE
ncbi:hypothetical protein PENTCL1PPCAC_10329, partial [Pristionchus entomophagus]